MKLPFLQMDADFIESGSRTVAALLNTQRHTILGVATDMFAWTVDVTSSDDKPPDGLIHGEDAARLLARACGWRKDPDVFVSAFERAGVLERRPNCIRVKGTDRYADAWRVASSRRLKAKAAAKARWDREHAELAAMLDAHEADAQEEADPSLSDAPEMLGGCSSDAPAMLGSCSDDAPACLDGDGDGEKRRKEETESKSAFADGLLFSADPELNPTPPRTQPNQKPADLRDAWNSLTTKPLPRWDKTGKVRGRLAWNALERRPLEEWRTVFSRINDSPFCRGENERGWVADPDWALRPEGGKPEPASKVLEGKFDAPPKRAADPRKGVFRAEDANYSRDEINEKGHVTNF